MFISALSFARRLTYTILSLFGRSQIDLVCTPFFSCVRKALFFAKAHTSPGNVYGAALSAAFVAHVSLVSTMQAGD